MSRIQDRKMLISFLYDMLRIRMAEEKIVELYPEEEIRCPVHLCIGQEAVCVGVAKNLTQEDIVLSNHRSHGHYLAKGGDLKQLFAEMYGKPAGCSKGRGGSMHLIDLSVNFLGSTPIVGGTIPVAAGAALGEKMRGRKTATVAFFGDAAIEEGVFHESANFAALKKLPILFICENNLYSVYTPLRERQPNRKICDLVAGHGIKVFQEDGNDVRRVYAAAKKSLKMIRSGKGPVFIEYLTYRWREHCGPNYDNDSGYRSEKEFKKWKTQCPIARLEKYLLAKGLVRKEEIEDLRGDIKEEIDSAVLFAKSSSGFLNDVSEADVYAN